MDVYFFVVSLSNENCLVVSPVCLVSNMLHCMFEQKAVCTLVLRFWSSSSFWPLISRIYANFIVDCRVFSGNGTLEDGRNANALLGSKRYKGSAMAVRLNFSRPQLSPNVCSLVLRLLLIGIIVFTSLFLWHWPTRRHWFGNQPAPGVCCVMTLPCDCYT